MIARLTSSDDLLTEGEKGKACASHGRSEGMEGWIFSTGFSSSEPSSFCGSVS